ncbi:ATP synthase f chain [Pediculus humanus corporis]|uniref:ATP synthase f chain n=1 Tax=Pediculus humanus subsp. corporis TaxID=121224 RepID=E0VCB5_PEDHC|nr:ATP synthase f chain [Pediculus humanus corporis]EEB11001.1 ATP synthase f chain [Pediculus humanus corporis]
MSFPNLIPKSWGEYPPEFNKAVHGYYDPSRYYGKPDTPFTEVKLKDLSSWFSRRQKTPRACLNALNRAYWRFNWHWLLPKKPGYAGFLQMYFGFFLVNYLFSYKALQKHQRYRYH